MKPENGRSTGSQRGGRWFGPRDLYDVRVVLEAAECGWMSGEAAGSTRRLLALLASEAES